MDSELRATRPDWSELPPAALIFRVAHAIWALISLIALTEIWSSAITGRHGRRLVASVGWLSLEGLALIKGRGDCPFGPLQTRLGDPVPLFQLVLPSRAAKAAVPVLAATSLLGIALAMIRTCRAWRRPA